MTFLYFISNLLRVFWITLAVLSVTACSGSLTPPQKMNLLAGEENLADDGGDGQEEDPNAGQGSGLGQNPSGCSEFKPPENLSAVEKETLCRQLLPETNTEREVNLFGVEIDAPACSIGNVINGASVIAGKCPNLEGDELLEHSCAWLEFMGSCFVDGCDNSDFGVYFARFSAVTKCQQWDANWQPPSEWGF